MIKYITHSNDENSNSEETSENLEWVLFLPVFFIEIYLQELSERNLLLETISDKFREKKNTEGLSHFQYSFYKSASRNLFLFLGIEDRFSNITYDYQKIFSDGSILIIDIPCGHGATLLSLLCIEIDLRIKEIKNCTPINLHIIAADINEEAMEIYKSLINKLLPYSKSVGIDITITTKKWNFKEYEDIGNFGKEIISNISNFERKYMFLSNFGDFIITGNTFKDNKFFLEFLLVILKDYDIEYFWIEPSGSPDKFEKFYKELKDCIDKNFKWLEIIDQTNNFPLTKDFYLREPLSECVHNKNCFHILKIIKRKILL
jgi:hypothetical protein